MKYFFGILSAVCMLLFFGIAGGVENDAISLLSGILLSVLALAGTFLFGFIAFILGLGDEN